MKEQSVSRYAKTLAEFEIPWPTHSPNTNFHRPRSKQGHRRLAKYKAETKWIFGMKTQGFTSDVIADGFIVTLTRLSSGTLDGDNLQGALKAVRDGVADGLWMDDKDSEAMHWRYAQEKCKRGYYGVRVKIEGIF